MVEDSGSTTYVCPSCSIGGKGERETISFTLPRGAAAASPQTNVKIPANESILKGGGVANIKGT